MPTPKKKLEQLKVVRQSIRNILQVFDMNLKDPDLKDTPKRVAKLFYEEFVERTTITKKVMQVFPSTYKSMVTMIGHRSFTRCPHHFERVELDVSLAYLPNGRLIGLSKLGRVVDYFSAGLMLQEEIAESITEGLMNALNPLGVAILIEGKHMCMRARGLKSTHSKVVTARLTGAFETDAKARDEFYHHVNRGKG